MTLSRVDSTTKSTTGASVGQFDYPAGIQSGDLLIVLGHARKPTALSGSFNSDFTVLQNYTFILANRGAIHLYYKVATGAETGTDDAWTDAGTLELYHASCILYRDSAFEVSSASVATPGTGVNPNSTVATNTRSDTGTTGAGGEVVVAVTGPDSLLAATEGSATYAVASVLDIRGSSFFDQLAANAPAATFSVSGDFAFHRVVVDVALSAISNLPSVSPDYEYPYERRVLSVKALPYNLTTGVLNGIEL